MDNRLTVQKLNNLNQRVEFVLERYPETRNSDLELQAQVCIQFYPPFETAIYNWRDFVSVMRSLPSLDHIARARRKVIRRNNYEKYLPTVQEVAMARKYNEEVWREYMARENLPTPIKGFSNIPREYQSLDERDEL